jgi:putative transposase
MHNENISEKEEIKVLKKLLRSTDNKRMHVRYQVILLHLKDYTNAHIAEIMDLNPHTIGIYINSYKQNGADGLSIGKSSGRPGFLSKDQEEKLYEIITTKTPDQLGFGNRKNWNASIACKWVSNNFHIEYSNRGMLQVFHRLNLSYTRPTYTLAKADEEKQEAFRQEFEVLKKPD